MNAHNHKFQTVEKSLIQPKLGLKLLNFICMCALIVNQTLENCIQFLLQAAAKYTKPNSMQSKYISSDRAFTFTFSTKIWLCVWRAAEERKKIVAATPTARSYKQHQTNYKVNILYVVNGFSLKSTSWTHGTRFSYIHTHIIADVGAQSFTYLTVSVRLHCCCGCFA